MRSKAKPECNCPESVLDKGWPRPWNCGHEFPTLYLQGDPHNPKRDFNQERRRECVLERLCQVCGLPLDERPWGLPNYGRTDAALGFNLSTLMHERCLALSLAQCPVLVRWLQEDLLSVVREPVDVRYAVVDRADGPDIAEPELINWEIVHARDSGTTPVSISEAMGKVPPASDERTSEAATGEANPPSQAMAALPSPRLLHRLWRVRRPSRRS